MRIDYRVYTDLLSIVCMYMNYICKYVVVCVTFSSLGRSSWLSGYSLTNLKLSATT